jgi:hypothetical protein
MRRSSRSAPKSRKEEAGWPRLKKGGIYTCVSSYSTAEKKINKKWKEESIV